MTETTSITNLPKFLYCESLEGEREFVLHTRKPLLLMEMTEDEADYGEKNPFVKTVPVRGTAQMLEDPQAYVLEQLEKGQEPASTLARVAREAGEFYQDYITLLEQTK